jgi:predicted RNA binding protein YcfA (HicA-like mRNA interferase family)
MPKLPQISGKQLVKLLEKIGFVVISQRGSHIKLKKTTSSPVIIIVPNHKSIKPGTLINGILKHIPLSVEVLIKLN